MFKSFKPFKTLKPPPLVLPRVTGEDAGGGLNGAQRLSVLNSLNPSYSLARGNRSLIGDLFIQRDDLRVARQLFNRGFQFLAGERRGVGGH